jgi:hypothetical protein
LLLSRKKPIKKTTVFDETGRVILLDSVRIVHVYMARVFRVSVAGFLGLLKISAPIGKMNLLRVVGK